MKDLLARLKNTFVGTKNGVGAVKKCQIVQICGDDSGCPKGERNPRVENYGSQRHEAWFCGYFYEHISDTAWEGTVKRVPRDRPDLVFATTRL